MQTNHAICAFTGIVFMLGEMCDSSELIFVVKTSEARSAKKGNVLLKSTLYVSAPVIDFGMRQRARLFSSWRYQRKFFLEKPIARTLGSQLLSLEIALRR